MALTNTEPTGYPGQGIRSLTLTQMQQQGGSVDINDQEDVEELDPEYELDYERDWGSWFEDEDPEADGDLPDSSEIY